jgi:hypothetical protein
MDHRAHLGMRLMEIGVALAVIAISLFLRGCNMEF